MDHIKRRYHDRFSHYFTPTEYQRFKEGAHFSGVGVAVNEVPEGLRVATVFQRTPAREARHPGGRRDHRGGREVDRRQGRGRRHREIRGPAGTKVTLTVRGVATKSSRDVTLTRREVTHPAGDRAASRRSTASRSATSGWPGFFAGAHGELRKEVESLYAQGAQGLVLDLRGNGGGLLTEAVLVSSIFVPDGTIVSTQGRTQRTRDLRGHRRRPAAAPDGRADQRRHRVGLRDRHRGARAERASPRWSARPRSARAPSRR